MGKNGQIKTKLKKQKKETLTERVCRVVLWSLWQAEGPCRTLAAAPGTGGAAAAL